MVLVYTCYFRLFIKGGFMYYCNGYKFQDYSEAKRYADFLLNNARIYRAIFTAAEVAAMLEDIAK